jgi:hypothetical protein
MLARLRQTDRVQRGIPDQYSAFDRLGPNAGRLAVEADPAVQIADREMNRSGAVAGSITNAIEYSGA